MRVGELTREGWNPGEPQPEIFAESLSYSSSGKLAYTARDAKQQRVDAYLT